MADKPRVKAPKKRVTHTERSVDNRRMLLLGGGVATVLVALAGAFFLLGAGGGIDADKARDKLAAAGCTFEVKPAIRNASDHSDFPDPDGTSKLWNTDPPTSGPHYGRTVIYGAYTEPVQIGALVHNLEHGGIYILYGSKVPDATVAQLRAFYDKHQNGTVLAPYPKLGNKIALGAWLVDGLPQAASDRGSGVLAKCTRFDEAAFGAFFDAFQYKGPESFIVRPSDMQPGEN
jgi:uncharacterized protein DUF3105